MRAVNLAPLLEQGEDLGFLPGQQAMDRPSSAGDILEPVEDLAVPPSPRPLPVEFEHTADPGQRPAGLHGVVDDAQQDRLGGPVDSSWDRAAQSQAAFPRSAANSMACSTIVACNRVTSAVSLAISVASALDCFGRPGRDACNAAMAPSRAVLRNVMIVERSIPASAAAATVVICPVSIRCHRSYFCSAVRNRFGRRGPDMADSPSYRTRTASQLWSESKRTLSRAVRRKPGVSVTSLASGGAVGGRVVWIVSTSR